MAALTPDELIGLARSWSGPAGDILITFANQWKREQADWEQVCRHLKAEKPEQTDVYALRKRLEEAEIDAATWRALAGPMWVGDESEGHFVCLACNEPGADDRGTKSIKHRPDCKYAAALAKEETK